MFSYNLRKPRKKLDQSYNRSWAKKTPPSKTNLLNALKNVERCEPGENPNKNPIVQTEKMANLKCPRENVVAC